MRLTLAAAAATMFRRAAQAHNFAQGTFIPQVIEGAGAAINDPTVLLGAIPLGVMASIWRKEGLLIVWPWFLAGTLAGVPLGGLASSAVVSLPLLAGIAAGLLGLIAAAWPAWLPSSVAALAGVFSTMSILAGHGVLQTPLGVLFGIVLGANAIPAVAATPGQILLEKFPYPWMRIGGRILSSWLVAVTLMYLAFQLRG